MDSTNAKRHIKATAKQVEGDVKETAGRVSGNDRMKSQGKLDRAEGKAQEVVADAADAVTRISRRVRRK